MKQYAIATTWNLREYGVLSVDYSGKNTWYQLGIEPANAIRKMNPEKNFVILKETEGEYVLKGVFNLEEREFYILKASPKESITWYYELEAEVAEEEEKEILAFLFTEYLHLNS